MCCNQQHHELTANATTSITITFSPTLIYTADLTALLITSNTIITINRAPYNTVNNLEHNTCHLLSTDIDVAGWGKQKTNFWLLVYPLAVQSVWYKTLNADVKSHWILIIILIILINGITILLERDLDRCHICCLRLSHTLYMPRASQKQFCECVCQKLGPSQ